MRIGSGIQYGSFHPNATAIEALAPSAIPNRIATMAACEKEWSDKLVQQYRADTRDRSKVRRGTVCKDRDRENRYLSIIEFDSYEDAMANSQLPETDALAKSLAELAELADGPPQFLNLEVIRTEEN